MKTLIDFALKEEYKRLESVGDKLAEIDSLIDWKTFRIILESMYILSLCILTKPFQEGDPKLISLRCSKCLFYNNGMGSLILNLRNSV